MSEFLAAANPISAELITNKTLRNEDNKVGLWFDDAAPELRSGFVSGVCSLDEG